MRPFGLTRPAIVALVSALTLLGCAQEGDLDAAGLSTTTEASTTTSSTTTSPTIQIVSKEAYVADANAVCQVMNDEIAALPDPGSDLLAYADVLDQAVIIVSDALGELRALTPPIGDEDAVEAIWAKVDVLVEEYTQLSVAIRNDETALVSALDQTAQASQTAANEASIAYGLTVCGA